MRKKIILVIEEEINLANGLKSILEKEGYEVVSVFGSHHLKELFQNQRPDLAIIDLYIPKQLGLNILHKTKELFPSLPIIAMTVYTNFFTKRELSRLGADDFIAKPFDVRYLKERIEALIGRKVVTV